MTTTAISPAETLIRFERLDPRTLLLEHNIRRGPHLDSEFLASVRDLGVLVPIVAVQREDGPHVRYGKRRTLAAVEVAQPTVPVLVVAASVAGSEVDRIVQQWAENEHRTGLDEADKVDAVEQLSLLGVPARSIAKRLRAPRAEVDAALAVAASPLARTAAEQHDLTLGQAAVLAEFDDDPDPRTAEALVCAAQDGPGAFAHAAQRVRDERERVAREDIASSGIRVLTGRCPGHRADGPVAPLTYLGNTDGTRLTPADHATCPGHAAYLGVEYGWWTEQQAATVLLAGAPDEQESEGPQVDPDDLDVENLEPDEDEEATDSEDGQGRTRRGRYVALYVCDDYPAHGHQPTWAKPGRSEALTDQAQDARAKEVARAERRRVIDNNKA